MAKKKSKRKVASTTSKIETTRRYKDGTKVEVTKPVTNTRAKTLTKKNLKRQLKNVNNVFLSAAR
jgi:hypothetical protein